MGAWDVGSFGNDTACDWVYQLEGEEGAAIVASTLFAVVETASEYLDADVACEGLAAAEVVARLRGNHGTQDSYTEAVDSWVKAHPHSPEPELVTRALAAIDRVLTEPSELRELWADTDDFEAWQAAVAELRARVAA